MKSNRGSATKSQPKPTVLAQPDPKKLTRGEFMRSLDWSPVEALGLKMQWIGSELFIHLDQDRRAAVSISTNGHAEHYVMLVVRIVNKREGQVDSKSFGFSEYLREVGRSDTRHDMPDQRFEVVSHVGWHWYIAVPKTTKPLTEAVAAYAALFA